ncbi:MAG TPA: dihydrolipoamide acetyltransferase family protein [Candidatus Limnocylindria bacterium]|jgi:2-oxoisovalerate dehydrogenase E2 component (dihydrolipoyl transacylase)|nr:dihydrolipoamide acetyltransferase family protein [Candidatus Limnocylindria bacterium]
MPTTITMPQLGETVTEGTVAQWLKKPGDAVEKYEAFVEISTDKVNAEVPAPVTGVIRELLIAEGQTVPIGAPIAVIEEVAARSAEPVEASPLRQAQGDTVSAFATGAPSANGSSTPAPANGVAAATAAATAPGGLRVSPAVRRLAREHRIELTRVRGTGEHGRITARDILAAAQAGPSAGVAATITADNAEYLAPAPAASAPAARPSYGGARPGELIPLTQARRIIAQRMVDSKHTAPHAWTMVEVDVTNLWKWRLREKDAFEQAHGVKLTLLPFFIRAAVESLAAFPLMNASFSEDGIRVHREVNVGIAIAAEGNLVVPVIRGADQLSVRGLALAAGALIDKARRGKLGADDLAGGTFTVNNTGANGSILSAPILVPGQTGIVTTEAVVKRPIVRDDDSIAIRSMMNVCLSLDHRVVDGAVASGFLSDLKRRLEAMGPTGSL